MRVCHEEDVKKATSLLLFYNHLIVIAKSFFFETLLLHVAQGCRYTDRKMFDHPKSHCTSLVFYNQSKPQQSDISALLECHSLSYLLIISTFQYCILFGGVVGADWFYRNPDSQEVQLET